MKYRGSKPMVTLEDADAFIENQEVEEANRLTLRKGVELVESGELIGSVMFRFQDRDAGECEIGYSIGKAYWNNGFGKEIVQKMLEELEMQTAVAAVIAWSRQQNVASTKILKQAGFQLVEQTEHEDSYLFRRELKKV
jgi:RimJ/RimL family protein N-acetyltransferase